MRFAPSGVADILLSFVSAVALLERLEAPSRPGHWLPVARSADDFLSQYEAVKAKQATLAQEQDDMYRRYIDLRLRIEGVDREALRVNEAKPFLSDDDGRLLGDTESVARAAGFSIMKDLELPASTRDAGTLSLPSQPFAAQVAMNMAETAPVTSPDQVAARNAALLRKDTEWISVAGETVFEQAQRAVRHANAVQALRPTC